MGRLSRGLVLSGFVELYEIGRKAALILFMEQILKCPIVFMGLSLPEHGYHAPNENYDWHQASGGIMAFAKFIEEVAHK